EGVTGLDTWTPHVGQHVGNPSERCRLPRRRSVHEVRKLAGLFARQEQSRAPNEKDLSGTDPRGVQLVVDHHRARAMKRDPTALVTQPLRRATVRLPHPGRVYGAERPAGTERIFAIPLRGAAFTIASTSSRSRSRISVAQ